VDINRVFIGKYAEVWQCGNRYLVYAFYRSDIPPDFSGIARSHTLGLASGAVLD